MPAVGGNRSTHKIRIKKGRMHIFKLEHSKVYHTDLALYCIMVVALAAFLLVYGPREQRVANASFVLAGLVSWPAIEYALHRFVLHGVQPFRRWHEGHHRRPRALIFTPTILSAVLVFLPALLATGLWRACALSLGVLTGYLVYTMTHHAVHHWHFDNTWLKKRKRWHALHHHRIEQPGYYGLLRLDQRVSGPCIR